MIKRIYFGNPAYLSKKDKQLVIHFPYGEHKGTTVSIGDIAYKRCDINGIKHIVKIRINNHIGQIVKVGEY